MMRWACIALAISLAAGCGYGTQSRNQAGTLAAIQSGLYTGLSLGEGIASLMDDEYEPSGIASTLPYLSTLTQTYSPSPTYNQPDAPQTQVAQSACDPMPPRCKDKTDQGKAAVVRVMQRQAGGITGSASMSYCLHLISADVNVVCAQAYRAIGRYECANSYERNAEKYRSAMQQAVEIHDASSEVQRQLRHECEW